MTKTIYNPTTNPIPTEIRPSGDDVDMWLPDGGCIICFDHGKVVDPARIDMHRLMVETVDEDGSYLCAIISQPRSVTVRSAVSDSLQIESSGRYSEMSQAGLYLEAARLVASGCFIHPKN